MRQIGARHFILACLALAVAYFALFGFHSYAPLDPGFMLAYSWRFLGGQVPYVDFLHVRPPLPIYLHATWLLLPEPWMFPASRFGHFAEMALAAGLPAAAAVRAGLVSDRPRALLIMLAFLLLALGNFPVMPWHTIDGVLFSSIALSCWLQSTHADTERERLTWLAACSATLALTALCKQPFALIPLCFAICITAGLLRWRPRTGRDVAGSLAAIVPGLLVAAVFVGMLAWQDALGPFIDQVVVTPLSTPPARSGLASYLAGPGLAILPGLAWPILANAARRDRKIAELLPLLELVAVGVIAWSLGPAQIARVLLSFLIGSILGRIAINARRSPSERDPREWIRVGLAMWVALTALAA